MNGTETATNDDEISLLDLLVIMAENWLWLVLVPLVLGIGTYLFLVLQPGQYQASATVPAPPADVVAFLEGPGGGVLADGNIVLGEAVGENGLAIGAAREGEASQLTMTSAAPEAARERLTIVTDAIWQALGRGDIPAPENRYADRIAELEAVIALRSSAIERLQEALAEGAEGDEQTFALTALALAQMLGGRADELDRLENFRAAGPDPVADLERTDVSVERLGRSPLLTVALVIIGSGFVMLIAVFVRHGFKSVAQNPEARIKLQRIRDGLLLRRRNSNGA